MKLTPPQMRRAELQLTLGRTLGEISHSLGVPFELVCLALFGGGAGWVPPAATDTSLGAERGLSGDQPWASLDGADGEPNSLEGAEVSQRGSLHADAPDAPAIAEGDGPAASSASQTSSLENLNAEPGSTGHWRGNGVASDGDRDAGVAVAPAPSSRVSSVSNPPLVTAAEAERDGLREEGGPSAAAEPAAPGNAAPAAVVGRRYRLHNGLGEYLHEHERGLTRVSKFFWRGTEAEVVALWKRRPHFRDLEMEPITDTRVQP